MGLPKDRRSQNPGDVPTVKTSATAIDRNMLCFWSSLDPLDGSGITPLPPRWKHPGLLVQDAGGLRSPELIDTIDGQRPNPVGGDWPMWLLQEHDLVLVRSAVHPHRQWRTGRARPRVISTTRIGESEDGHPTPTNSW